MKFNFRKIVSVLASTVMVGSTVAMAAAASYPAPFVKNGMADVAVVYGGSTAATSDLVATIDIQQELTKQLLSEAIVPSSSGATTNIVGGDSVALFTTGTPLYLNDTIDNVKDSITKTGLKTVLGDGTFSGNVDSDYTQTINLGKNPVVSFAKEPTTDDEPGFGILVSTTPSTTPIYNATVSFSKAVNFTHSDSIGEDITLFGQKFTVSADTDSDSLVLLKSAERISLTSDDPSSEVTIDGKTYTIELVSSSDTSATIKVTDSAGVSENKEINENKSKKVQGISVAVINADENNLRLSATVIVGSEKVTLENGNSVGMGDDNDPVDGTTVSFVDTTYTGNISKIRMDVAAEDSDHDFIKPGMAFVDPVFGTFKIDFAGLNMPLNSSDREDIKVASSGSHSLGVNFADHKSGEAKTIQYAQNMTSGRAALQIDNNGRNMSVMEKQAIHVNDYVVVGNENEGYLLKVTRISNSSSSTASDDKVTFQNVFTETNYDTLISTEGTGTVNIEGKDYSVIYSGANSVSEQARTVRLGYPDGSKGGAGTAVAYPTIETSKGAKLMFYSPLVINFTNWDGATNALTTLKIPNGADGYDSFTIAYTNADGIEGNWSVKEGTTYLGNVTTGVVTTNGFGRVNLSVGSKLTFSMGNYSLGEYVGGVTTGGAWINNTQLVLLDPASGAAILNPAIVVIEEKDDNSEYNALVVTTRFSSDNIGVNDVVRTWSNDAQWDLIQSASNDDIYYDADLFGTVVTTDESDTNAYDATISYPDEQATALVYAADNSATITTSGAGTGATSVTQPIVVTDSEVSSVSAKNMVIVGGSCVNTVAAKLLESDSPVCGSDFTTKTRAASGQYIIQTFESPYASTKVATLVAGYEAQDTTNAATYLTTQSVDTTTGKKYLGTTATTAELQVASTEGTTA